MIYGPDDIKSIKFSILCLKTNKDRQIQNNYIVSQ